MYNWHWCRNGQTFPENTSTTLLVLDGLWVKREYTCCFETISNHWQFRVSNLRFEKHPKKLPFAYSKPRYLSKVTNFRIPGVFQILKKNIIRLCLVTCTARKFYEYHVFSNELDVVVKATTIGHEELPNERTKWGLKPQPSN